MGETQTYTLPADLTRAVQASLEEGRAGDKTRRLWAKDASIWTGADESRWLDWLQIVSDQRAGYPPAGRVIEPFRRLASEVKEGGFSHAMVLGMGGSSLF